eukprot:CCRYP_017653-RB/>CCRYP_017653-RB protein AED:0.20 eAED:0.20 QI:294/0.9/0.81/1/0.8/0.63/11/1789/1311
MQPSSKLCAILFWVALTPRESLVSSLPMEEFHDLDDQHVDDQEAVIFSGETENLGDLKGSDARDVTIGRILNHEEGMDNDKNNADLIIFDSSRPALHSDTQEKGHHFDHKDDASDDDSLHQSRTHSIRRPNHILDRFSQIIFQQIMNRFQLPPQLRLPTFPFQPPWDRPRKNPNFASIAWNDGKKYSLVNGNNIRKIGALCPPTAEDSTEFEVATTIDDEVLILCEPDPSKSVVLENCKAPDNAIYDDSTTADDEIQAGMILYVLPSSETLDEYIFASEKHLDTSVDATVISNLGEDNKPYPNNENPRKMSKCVVEMGKRYDTNSDVAQYSLIRRVTHELGHIDVHRKDFAYHPVALKEQTQFSNENVRSKWNVNDFIGGGTEYIGHELETRISPESEAIEVRSTYDPSYYSSGSTNNNDRQVSFRWWSWIDHLNQFFRHGSAALSGDASSSPYDSAAMIPGYQYRERYSNRMYDSQSAYDRSLYEESGKQAFAGGSHGEIWRAKRRCPNKMVNCDNEKDYIVKRLKIELGYSVLEAGLREVYFGELLAREAESSNLVTSYIDHFFRESKNGQLELWIVFENAGPSLRSYLYTPVVDANGGFTVLQHSSFWRRLRKSVREHSDDADLALDIIRPKSSLQHESYEDNILECDHKNCTSSKKRETSSKQRLLLFPEGRQLLRDVLKQIITSVAFLHERGIVHRDIKPSNIMCQTIPLLRPDLIPQRIESVNCLLGDFSSAWDEYSKRNLYANGPSLKELTQEYAPPEVLLQDQGSQWSPFSFQNPYSYDSWSIGVVALEMLLGTPNVFSVDQRTTVVLTNKLRKEGASSDDIQRALYLAALSQFCIYVPLQGKSWPLRHGDPMHDAKVVKETCSLRDFQNALRARDPLGTGFDDSANTLLHLIWKLLAWDPLHRLSASEALLHPYFTSPTTKSAHDSPGDTLILSRTYEYNNPLPGYHNMLEAQLLDPQIDMNSSVAVSEFVCPKCGKKFSDYNSCQQHARSRKHARFCTYDRQSLPHCVNAHTMLPTHPLSGYCDIQGRRRTIEDFHSVHLCFDNQFYGIFDGHLGNLASKYAASSFYRVVEAKLSNIDENIVYAPDWKTTVQASMRHAFAEIHDGIMSAVTSSPGGIMDESGTTATILYVTDLTVIIANVGDSRAVLSQWKQDSSGQAVLSSFQLTEDHIASSLDEQLLIVERGGFVSKSGGIERVNGILAVSRSLGDAKLTPFLSHLPFVATFLKSEVREICETRSCFIILASDGLWDVMTNLEAVEMVEEAIRANKRGSAFQVAAEWLTQEAYVRGSLDNIGVCVVAIT